MEVRGTQRNVLAKWPETDLGVPVDVTFADFDKTSAISQKGKTARQGLARQGVEHDVDASTAGDFHYFIGKGKRVRVHHVVRAEHAEQFSFFSVPGSGENFAATRQCDLHCC